MIARRTSPAPRAPAPWSSAPDCRRAPEGLRRCRRDSRPARRRARFQRAVGARRDRAGAHRKLGRERHHAAAVGKARADGRADAAVQRARRMPCCRQKASSAPAKSWFGRSRSAKARLSVFARRGRATGPNSLKLVSGSGSAMNIAPSMPKASTSNGSATTVSSGSMWPPLTRPSASVHSAVAMEERRAVALAERHRSPASAASRHRAERCRCRTPRSRRSSTAPASHRRMARAHRRRMLSTPPANPCRGKTAARGFQQRQAGFKRERESAPPRFHPLDALGAARPGLLDAAHRAC